MEPILLSFAVFILVAGGVLVVAWLVRPGTASVEDRLSAFTGKKTDKSTPSVSEAVEIWRKVPFEEDGQSLWTRLIQSLPRLEKLFLQADCGIPPSRLISVSVGLGVGSTILLVVLGMPLFLALVVGLALGSVPWIWLWNKRRTRLLKFAAQLPDALELIARALRAGHSLGSGFHLVAEELPPPLGSEFGRVYEEQNLGISIEDALKNLCERVPNLDLRFFTTSVIIQRQTGGDLAEILDKIGHLIRERYRIQNQVKALTGEGRLSGVVLIALPFVLFLVMLYINPEYVSMLWKTEVGIKMSLFALVMQILGALVIRKIVNIKV
ncbi:MAG: type II secretion system F family protein [Gemmatales bacterium]|nr:type II secretion system F family protein [Gemmatales bacterium]MCS7161090.1 type II secretion system F family protein [Gemmatales bacterium]MDW8176293.1 type II secretion system F family protein [Gemmatales bacterium]MDW8223189.1 type II secretion system F family protein [Gemmatales bacterium]